MTRKRFLLGVFQLAQIHRGEEKKVLSFLGLLFCLSTIVGLLSSGIDPLYMLHNPDGIEARLIRFLAGSSFSKLRTETVAILTPLLQLGGALILVLIGFGYAGVTDRDDKRRLFVRWLVAVSAVCFAAFVLCRFDLTVSRVPFLYSALYVGRFVGGILLLLLFWDTAAMFFDQRQSKRLFPAVAFGSSLGYTVGSLLVLPVSRLISLDAVLLAAGAMGVVCVVFQARLFRAFPLVHAPRYRKQNRRREIREGFAALFGNRFLKTIMVSTTIFGLAAGFIMFTYNSIIATRFASDSGAAGLMALQRALFSLIESVIVYQLLSQSAMGNKLKFNTALRWLLLGLGFVAFAASMLGTADLTRQIDSALLSPAAMAAFAVIATRYRGRAIAINNLIIAPAGMAVASVVVFFLGRALPVPFFLSLIVLLLVARVVMNSFVNRAYLAQVTKSMGNFKTGDVGAFEATIEDAARDPDLFDAFLKRLADTDARTRDAVMRKVAALLRGPAQYEVVRRRLGESGEEPWRIELEGRFGSGDETLRRAAESASPESRSAARRLLILREKAAGRMDAFCRELARIKIRAFTFGPEGGLDAEALEALAVYLGLEDGHELSFLEQLYHQADPASRAEILRLLAGDDKREALGLFLRGLSQAETFPAALGFLERIENLDIAPVLRLFDSCGDASGRIGLIDLVARQKSRDAFGFLEDGFETSAGNFQDAGSAATSDDSILARLFLRSEDEAKEMIAFITGLLAFPFDYRPSVPGLARRCADEAVSAAALLFAIRKKIPLDPERPRLNLLGRYCRQEIASLVTLGFGFAALTVPKTERRMALRSGLQLLSGGSAALRGHLLEIVSMYFEPKYARALTAFLENLGTEERRLRLAPLLAGKNPEPDDLVAVWKRHAAACPSPVRKELAERL